MRQRLLAILILLVCVTNGCQSDGGELDDLSNAKQELRECENACKEMKEECIIYSTLLKENCKTNEDHCFMNCILVERGED